MMNMSFKERVLKIEVKLIRSVVVQFRLSQDGDVKERAQMNRPPQSTTTALLMQSSAFYATLVLRILKHIIQI